MITLYREQVCERSDWIQERLADFVVAHRVVVADGDAKAEPMPSLLPTLQDGIETFNTEAGIQACLDRIEKRMEQWNRYQSDSCYIGDDNELC